MGTEGREKTIQAAAQHAEKTLGSEGFRYVSIVVANCKMLALQREAQDENDFDSLTRLSATSSRFRTHGG